MTLSIASYPVCNLKGECNAMYSPFFVLSSRTKRVNKQ
nr:MAG TPA: hypothetical protein [Caudoviricetes sp.]